MDDTKSETVSLQPVKDEAGEPLNKPSVDDYDPHDYRQVDKPTNNWESLAHLLKCSLGTGILAMPQAFANAGLVTGIIGTVLLGILVTHCLHILVRAQYSGCKKLRVPLLSYPQSMTAALKSGPEPLRKFSSSLAITVDVFLVLYQLGICCVYIVFIAGNIKKLTDPYYEMRIEYYMFIILIPLIAFNLIPNLKLLAPFSAFANLLIFVSLGIVVYYLLSGQKPSENRAPLDLWGSAASFPLFFGTVLFALTAVGVVVAIENNMKSPKSFGTPCGVLNVGMTIIVCLYILIGAFGYLFCVSECSDSIALDLPRGPLANSVSAMYSVAIFITYPLQCYVPVEVIWLGYMQPRLERSGAAPARKTMAMYGLRITLCIITFIFAVVVPRLGLYISLFGALCLSALGICFPALMEMCLSFPDKFGPGKIRLIKDIAVFIVGIVGLVAGTYTALLGIIMTFLPEN